MSRVKGLVSKSHIKQEIPNHLINHPYYSDIIEVEETPASAIRCEAVVKEVVCTEWSYAFIEVPTHLIGKRVSVIIIEEEN